ncbi:hypothetical protein F4W70_16380 [Pseudomonas cannabina]|nr:hypothetical protein F4W70_16380 [Pseudomonas cannabina]
MAPETFSAVFADLLSAGVLERTLSIAFTSGFREGLKKPFLQKSKPVNTGAPARFLSKKMGFFRGYLGSR